MNDQFFKEAFMRKQLLEEVSSKDVKDFYDSFTDTHVIRKRDFKISKEKMSFI